jgi:hypothetical protein
LCPDCSYDLVGLQDGRCPECGGSFTHVKLRKLYWARQAMLQERRKAGITIAAGVTIFALPLLCSLNTTLGVAGALACWTIAAAIWFWFNRKTWIAHAYVVLGLNIPLVLMMLSLAATSYGRLWCMLLAAMVCAVSVMALRWSPLISGLILILAGAFPILLLALAMYSQASIRIAGGHYWSDFDQPTPTGWRALPAYQSVVVAKWIAGFGVAVVIVVLIYARRAWVRLTR